MPSMDVDLTATVRKVLFIVHGSRSSSKKRTLAKATRPTDRSTTEHRAKQRRNATATASNHVPTCRRKPRSHTLLASLWPPTQVGTDTPKHPSQGSGLRPQPARRAVAGRQT